MKKKNILLLLPYGSVGGMERLALTFYNYYKNKGYNIKALKFIKLESDIIHFGEDELYIKDKDFSEMKTSERALFYFKAPKAIRKVIKKYKITHSIAFGDMANIFSSLTLTNEFKIGSIHALKSVELNNNTWFNKIIRFGYKSFYKKLDKLVCISNAIKDDLKQNCGYRFTNLAVIYNPHDITAISNLSLEKITDDAEKNIFLTPTLLFLGRLCLQKSPWHLINAFYLLQKEKPNTNLVFIGDGDTTIKEYLIEKINELGLNNKVYFLGRKSNPYKYIAAAKALVLTSHYEGTPNVIVESIALNTPIVSSLCTQGIVEIMSNKEYNITTENVLTDSGVITPNFFKGKLGIPEDSSITLEETKFSEGLVTILDNNEMITKKLIEVKQTLLSKFDLNYVADTYLKEYKNNSN
ncbi:hypothetical protein IX49_13260 [Cellulophaga lytica]|uniref:glycosyltransferase n=1 Tax=Cellulophaga lytica TaxID=979 RepID=UPI0004F7E489|nr:glycosyltransferase [Cellulophaga lytica]AIM61441.1 hypothetical protein IX49_13260 [Cellulophaga lytica]